MNSFDCDRQAARARESASSLYSNHRFARNRGSLPCWNNVFGSDHLYGLNCHSCPVVITHTTRSLCDAQIDPASQQPVLTDFKPVHVEYLPSLLDSTELCEGVHAVDDEVARLPGVRPVRTRLGMVNLQHVLRPSSRRPTHLTCNIRLDETAGRTRGNRSASFASDGQRPVVLVLTLVRRCTPPAVSFNGLKLTPHPRGNA